MKVKSKGSAVSDHLLLSKHSPSFESFKVRTKGNKKLVLEFRESLLIIKDKPLNKSIRSELFDRVYFRLTPLGV